jgi:hypothetical protein
MPGLDFNAFGRASVCMLAPAAADKGAGALKKLD